MTLQEVLDTGTGASARAALPIWVDYVTHTSWWPPDELMAPEGVDFA